MVGYPEQVARNPFLSFKGAQERAILTGSSSLGIGLVTCSGSAEPYNTLRVTVNWPLPVGACVNLVGEWVGRGFGVSLSTVGSSGGRSVQAQTPQPNRSLVS